MKLFIKISFITLLLLWAAESQLNPTILESYLRLVTVDVRNNVQKEPKDEKVIYKVKKKNVRFLKIILTNFKQR